jgi:hypothetical protein
MIFALTSYLIKTLENSQFSWLGFFWSDEHKNKDQKSKDKNTKINIFLQDNATNKN